MLVTHETDVVRRLADRVAVLEQGRVVEAGTVCEVSSSPRSRTSPRGTGGGRNLDDPLPPLRLPRRA